MEQRLARALEVLAGAASVPEENVINWLERDAEALGQIAEVLRVGETSFFRDRVQWEAIAERVLPSFLDRPRLTALSAGCATGEEAWTLAMLLDRAGLGKLGGRYRVIGVDRSAFALATAREGVYPPEAARHLPQSLRTRYLVEELGSARVVDPLRSQVSFVLRDLTSGPPVGSYDLILCKNLLIYCAEDSGRRIVSLLFGALAEDGALLVGRSEVARVRALGHRGEEIAPGVTAFRGE
jgi:chemotaxis methyl-accepting protein methylase